MPRSKAALAGVLSEEESFAAAAERQNVIKATRAVEPPLSLVFLSAGLANSISAVATNWSDCIKVRQQLEMQRQRRSFYAVGAAMVRTEGLRSLMNGATASCLREASYGTIRIGGYESCKQAISAYVPASSFANKLLSGCLSGAMGAFFSTPTDLVKVRFQAPRPNGRPPYRNAFAAFVEIYREGAAAAKNAQVNGQAGGSSAFFGGMRALYRGTQANTVRAMILTSTQVGTYDETKMTIKRNTGMQEGIGLHFASSMVAGLACSLASQPVDVIKTRVMQNRSANAVSLIRELLRNEGPLGLYKGFGMCWARLGTHTVISLTLFERFRALFGIKPL